MQWLIIVVVGIITALGCQAFFNSQDSSRKSSAANISQPAEQPSLFTRKSKRKARVHD